MSKADRVCKTYKREIIALARGIHKSNGGTLQDTDGLLDCVAIAIARYVESHTARVYGTNRKSRRVFSNCRDTSRAYNRPFCTQWWAK